MWHKHNICFIMITCHSHISFSRVQIFYFIFFVLHNTPWIKIYHIFIYLIKMLNLCHFLFQFSKINKKNFMHSHYRSFTGATIKSPPTPSTPPGMVWSLCPSHNHFKKPVIGSGPTSKLLLKIPENFTLWIARLESSKPFLLCNHWDSEFNLESLSAMLMKKPCP